MDEPADQAGRPPNAVMRRVLLPLAAVTAVAVVAWIVMAGAPAARTGSSRTTGIERSTLATAGPIVEAPPGVPTAAPTESLLTTLAASIPDTLPADVEATFQHVSVFVDVAHSRYRPDVLYLKAGVPARIVFSRGWDHMSHVESDRLGLWEDLTAGPVTVTLLPLEPGTYVYSSGESMVEGSIVVR